MANNIYLVQPGYPFVGRDEKKGYFIPYAAGTLVAFAQSHPRFGMPTRSKTYFIVLTT